MRSARPRSLRRRLTLTYAGIALLTAVVLGGILVVVLNAHFSSVDEANLPAGKHRLHLSVEDSLGRKGYRLVELQIN